MYLLVFFSSTKMLEKGTDTNQQRSITVFQRKDTNTGNIETENELSADARSADVNIHAVVTTATTTATVTSAIPTTHATRSVSSKATCSSTTMASTIDLTSNIATTSNATLTAPLKDNRTLSTGSLKIRSSQLTISETIERSVSYSKGGAQYESVIKHLLYFICNDHRPFYIINGKGFRQLIKMLAPHIKLPSVDTLKQRLDDLYDVTLEKYKCKLKNADYYALTFDIWSEMRSTRSFLGVTIHYLENGKINSKILTTEPLNTRHTAENISEHLEQIIDRFDLSKQNIVAAVTDRGANVVAAVNMFLDPSKHIPCFAHTINRIVEKVLEDDQLSALVKKVRDIVKFFKNSVIQSDMLRAKQGNKNHKLILDVKTRWNSTYYMLERYVQLRSILFDILFENTHAPALPTATENSVIQKIILILKPFEYVTKDLCGENYVTISKVIPTVNCLRQEISSIKSTGEECTLIARLKELAIKEINNRVGLVECNNLMAVSTVLDPRFKNLHFTDPNACARAISFIRRNVNASDDLSPQRSSSDPEPDDTYDFWSTHKKLVREKQIRRLEGERDETSLYLANPISSLRSNPFEQWEEMKSVFPRLYALAKKFLIVPATSVPSERLFSVAGATASETRNRLTGARLNKLLFMSDCGESDWNF